MRIALAGNPNSGKTTMYNALTGQSERVGNWAGVTVDKKEHRIKRRFVGGRDDAYAVDLPGAYSMSPYTSEESVTSEYVKNENPDVIINIIDATSPARGLFFTTELLELGIPVIVALNKSDVAERAKMVIDTSELSRILGSPVVETVSSSKRGLSELIEKAIGLIGTTPKAPFVGRIKVVDAESGAAADRERYGFVNGIVEKVIKSAPVGDGRADRLDDILTNKWLGIPIFAAVMFLVFWISQSGPTVFVADLLTGLLERGMDAVSAALNSDSIWASILVDGIIGGFIAIVGFLPLVMVMYFLIALLEDCGYMARATVVLDPIFKRVGLSGKSVIPFVIGTGCAVPGVMACRTIRDERERRATAILAPLMPCGAKLPVISLFAGSFFTSGGAWVGASMYFLSIILIFLSALLVNAITSTKRRSQYFIMELPEYKIPSITKAAKSMLERGWSYVVKAGTVILVCNFAVHLMTNFDFTFHVAESPESSILAAIATPVSYFIAPIVGVVAWQLAAATVTGFIAKENVVATLAVCYSLSNLLESGDASSGGAFADALGISTGAALAFLLLNLFTPPCFAAMGAMLSELKSKKWFFAGLGLQLAIGYSVGFITYFFATVFTEGFAGREWMPILGWSVVLASAAALVTLSVLNQRKICAREAEKGRENLTRQGA